MIPKRIANEIIFNTFADGSTARSRKSCYLSIMPRLIRLTHQVHYFVTFHLPIHVVNQQSLRTGAFTEYRSQPGMVILVVSQSIEWFRYIDG